MGGFEGGDEGGFWDIDAISTLVDKQNDNKSKHTNRAKHHIKTSESGFSIKAHARKGELFDTISFVPCECETFSIEGYDDIPIESNSIYKAYQALCDFTNDSDIEDFFYEHKVVLSKGIPSNMGLGGASADAAAFMLLLKEVCNLVLSSDELVNIGSGIDADVPFFIYNYPCPNNI